MPTEIKPKYATFEQAKWLKEIGFNVPLSKIYNDLGQLWNSHYSTMKNSNPDSGACCVAPEQWQVVEWLRVNHKLFISIIPTDINSFKFIVFSNKVAVGSNIGLATSETPEEAYSKAFDYLLTNKLI